MAKQQQEKENLKESENFFKKIWINYTVGFFGSIMGGIFLLITTSSKPISINLFTISGFITASYLAVCFMLLYLLGLFVVYLLIVRNFKTLLLGIFVLIELFLLYCLSYFERVRTKIIFLLLIMVSFITIILILKKNKK